MQINNKKMTNAKIKKTDVTATLRNLQVGQSVTFWIAGAYAETSYSYLQVWKSRNKAPLKIVTINNGLQAVVTRENNN